MLRSDKGIWGLLQAAPAGGGWGIGALSCYGVDFPFWWLSGTQSEEMMVLQEASLWSLRWQKGIPSRVQAEPIRIHSMPPAHHAAGRPPATNTIDSEIVT